MRFDLPTFEDLPSSGLAEGSPLQLAVADIDEDPDQPRQDFDPAALQELAATIAERGVRQPVSVRPHPIATNRWMLNFGARRLRASILAGKDLVPAFVDLAIDSYDQVIENEQREGLKPLELALFIERRLLSGSSQAEVARRLGKSRTYVTMACALIDAPDWLMEVYRQGKCRGMTELYELRRLHATAPGPVEQVVAERARIARSDIEALRCRVDPTNRALALGLPSSTSASRRTNAKPNGPVRPASSERLRVTARLDGQDVRVDLAALPADPAEVFVSGANQQRLSVRIEVLTQLGLSRAD